MNMLTFSLFRDVCTKWILQISLFFHTPSHLRERLEEKRKKEKEKVPEGSGGDDELTGLLEKTLLQLSGMYNKRGFFLLSLSHSR